MYKVKHTAGGTYSELGGENNMQDRKNYFDQVKISIRSRLISRGNDINRPASSGQENTQ